MALINNAERFGDIAPDIPIKAEGDREYGPPRNTF